MQNFVHSSEKLLLSTVQNTAGLALRVSGKVTQTACLPVTVPLNIMAAATDYVINMTGSVIGGVLHRTIGVVNENKIEHQARDCSDEAELPEDEYQTPVQDLLHNVFNFIPFVVDNAVKTAFLSVETPALVSNQKLQQERAQKEGGGNRVVDRHAAVQRTTTANEKSGSARHIKGNDDFLERLRLDFLPMEECEEDSDAYNDDGTTRTASSSNTDTAQANISSATKSDVSKCLLRVDDVHVVAPPNPASKSELRVVYIDLGKEFGDEGLNRDALEQLIQRGIDIASSNLAVKVEVSPVRADSKRAVVVEWKPQGQTKNECKRLSQLPQSAFYNSLKSKVLIWSGNWRGPKYHGSEHTMFMARGVVKGSPREFMNLLWDSSRTFEYNNYCLGRRDVHVIDDEILSGGSYGAKVIRSETKIPFTSLSVFLTALMHARAISDRPDDGFMIFSRSLYTGRAGCHVGSKHVDLSGNKNEIIVGVNYMRPVPGHPELTDLISVSQVNASMLPPFLAFRIGMMGVEDFFKNVR